MARPREKRDCKRRYHGNKSIDHIGLIVKDMEKAVRFYTDVMGFALTGEITPWAGSAEECAGHAGAGGTEYRCATV